jgi:hypothetical protein
MTPEATSPESAAFKRDDIELVKLFLSQYKDPEGDSYTVQSRPEETERKAKAIEAIAVTENGKRLGIEHTAIHPFAGKKSDDVPFVTVFEQLRTEPSFRIPNRFIDVLVPTGAIPKGVEWKELTPKVREWFMKAVHKFPMEGETDHDIPDLGFPLKVHVHTFALPETDGVTVVGRMLPPGDPFAEVLQKALTTKVPKLAGTGADRRILLLEDEGVAIGFTKITEGIDARVKDLPDLKNVDEVWCVHTMGWKSNGDALFCHIWPGGVKERFWIKDERFKK